MKALRKTLWILSLTGFLLGISGCATEDDSTVQTRPWARPKGWESGIPSSLLEGR